MPAEQIPSFRKYLREHTWQQIVMRVNRGLLWYALLVGLYSYGYGGFLLLYLGLLGMLFWQNRHRLNLQKAWSQHATALVFVVLYFSGYLLLNAWFAPVSIGHRFVLTLYLPAMWLFVRGLSYAQEQGWTWRYWRGPEIHAAAISPLILMALAGYAVLIFPQRISSIYGGS